MSKRHRNTIFKLSATIACAISLHAATPITEITLPGDHLYTESITSLKDGTLFVGSIGKANVSRIPYGTTNVVEFIHPGANGLHGVYGIYGDEKHNTLYVCSNTDKGVGVAELKTFDLKSGAPKGSYTLPEQGSFCNDTATAADGTAYIADTRHATVLMLRPGASAFEVAAKDPLLESADGLAFGDKRILYVNGVSTGKLLRVDLGADGKATKVTDLKLSKPLVRPDGMRAIGKNRLLLAENGAATDTAGGVMSIITFSPDGQTAQFNVIKSGIESTPAVTATKGMAWIAEGKLNYRSTPDRDPGTFKLYAVPLPKK
jgi:hypothetical protein